MEVFNDSDIDSIPIAVFVDSIAEFVVADFEGRTTAPPRQGVEFPAGKIVFTTGGVEQVAGFRAYETFVSRNRVREDQIVVVWDTDTCRLKGVCFGTRLGAIRTGVLGGIAVDALAPHSVSTCAIIGTGFQAETQLLGVLARRDLQEIRVYSRSPAKREAFVERMSVASSGRVRTCNSPDEAVSGADVVVLATDSDSPVVDAAWLENAAHITTVGPKFRDAHEIPLQVVGDRLLVSDSPQQIQKQRERHMLFGHPRWGEVVHLGEMISRGRPQEPVRTLYLSAGLAGTEVIALDAAIRHRGSRF